MARSCWRPGLDRGVTTRNIGTTRADKRTQDEILPGGGKRFDVQHPQQDVLLERDEIHEIAEVSGVADLIEALVDDVRAACT